MYQLYIANKNYSSWSLRPWSLMRELSIDFEERFVTFDEGSSWTSFRAFSPNGRVPCLVDGDTVVWDSIAITEYLAERHSGVWPADRRARAWARCASAEMHSGFGVLRGRCPMNCGVRIRLKDLTEALQRDVTRIDELWTEGLNRYGGPFLTGDAFTAVDAFFTPVAFRVLTYGLELNETAAAYAKRLLTLQSVRSWYEAALLEPWREIEHEEEAKRTGVWLADLRANPA